MPNPSMRQARAGTAAPYTTDQDGNRIGDRPTVGPVDPATLHAALQAQDAQKSAPLAANPNPASAPSTPNFVKGTIPRVEKAVSDAGG